MISLNPMTQEEFQFYLNNGLSRLAENLSKARDINFDEASRLSRCSFETLFPNGLVNAKDQFVFNILSNREYVGVVHFGIRRDRPIPYLYIWDFFVDSSQRKKGIGKCTLKKIEVEARRLSLKKICLNVFGHNTPAISLYSNLGYQPESILMVKEVPNENS